MKPETEGNSPARAKPVITRNDDIGSDIYERPSLVYAMRVTEKKKFMDVSRGLNKVKASN